MKLRALFPCLVLAAFSGLVRADEIYRCGTVYSQTPCSKGERIDASDPRTDEQRLHAQLLAAKTEASGDAMERERLATEAVYRPALAGSLNSSATQANAEKPRSRPKGKRQLLRSKSADVPKLSVKQPSRRTSSRR